jgi:hypothetical protein
MQARCPRCASIFATDRSGLQFCPNCGQQVDVPTFPGAPPESAGAGWGGPSGPGGPGSFGPGPALREDTPWERRASIGWFRGLFETWKRTLFTPQAFWASVKPDGSWTDALIYGWILATISILLSAPLGPLGLGGAWVQSALSRMDDLPPGAREAIRSYLSGASAVQLGCSVFLYPLFAIIGAALLHLFCMLFGASKNGFYATLRVLMYAGATHVFSPIPCVGFLAGLYGGVLLILGLASVQQTSLGRATAAVVAPFLLCCGLVVAAFGLGMLAMLHSVR